MRNAAKLYRELCQRCHGGDGTGSPGPDRFADIPDFTSGRWQKQRSDVQLLASILEGKGTRMPAFHDRIDEAQARQLVIWVRVFGPKASNRPRTASPALRQAAPMPSSPSEEDFERQFRKLEKELESLRKQFRELSRPPTEP